MDNHQKSHIKHLHAAHLEGRLVILAGAGVSANSGVPTWGTLITEMKTELPAYIQNETDYLKIAQLYKDARGEAEYLHKVKTVLRHNQVVPNIIHKAILDLEPSQIITPNYDNLFEQAIASAYRQYDTICEDRDLTQMHYPQALIKMHGDFEKGNIVLSETDYFHYSKNFPLIRALVLSVFASKVVLMTGFSFSDLNLKLILDDVQTVLQNKMQRVYLIADSEPDYHTQRYFENKGINIVYLPDVDLSDISVPDEDHGLSDERGLRLYKTLIKIKDYADGSEDPIVRLNDVINSYSKYLRVFGEGLKYLIPKSLFKGWNLHSDGLQLFSEYFQRLEKELSTFKGLLNFRRQYPGIDIRKIQEIAYLNYIFEIDGLNLMSKKRLNALNSQFREPAHEALYRFDFDKINLELKRLSSKSLKYDSIDLEYPYLLYKLGDYIGAYEQYDRILPQAWKSQKYVLYFICLFNMAALRSYVNSFTTYNPRQIDEEKLRLKLWGIYERLDSTLNRLPMEEPMRKIFQDLLSNRAIGAKALEIENLREEILNHKHLSQNGGFSMNSHVASLEGKYIRESNFSNYNYIILENNTYFQHLCKNAVIGMLNSFSIEDNSQSPWREFRQSKITAFDPYELRPMIFNVLPKDLRRIISQYDIKNLVLTQDAKDYINECLNNLTKANSHFIDSNLLIGYIGSLLVIIANSEVFEINIKKLYDFIIKYWDNYYFREHVEYALGYLVSVYTPDKESAEQLLYNIIYYSEDGRYFIGAVRNLVKILSKDTSYRMSLEFSRIRKDEIWDMIFPIYPIVEDSQKTEFADEAQKNIRHYGNYFKFLVSFNISITDETRFGEHLKIRDNFEENIAVSCYNISKMVDNPVYTNIKSKLQVFIADNICAQFMLDPINFTKKDKVTVSWLSACDAPMEELVKVPEYLELYKEALKQDKFTKYGKECLLGLWQNQNSFTSNCEASDNIYKE